MKKLFLSFAVIAGMSMISCGGNSDATTAENDSVAADTVEVAEVTDSVVAGDSVATDTTVVVAEEVAK